MLGLGFTSPQVASILGRPLFAPGAVLSLDFAGGRYRTPAIVTGADVAQVPGYSYARAGADEYAETAAGLLVPFAAGVPAITDRGFLCEPSATNLVANSATIGADLKAGGNENVVTTELPLGTGITVRKSTRRTAEADNNLGYRGGILTADIDYTFSMWVWVPSGVVVSGEGVGIGRGGASIVQANLAIRDRWQRLSFPFRSTSSGVSSVVLRATLRDGDSLYHAAPQIETGLLSGFVPTASVTATRAASRLEFGGLPLTGDLTLVGEVDLSASTAGARFLDLNDGADANKIIVDRSNQGNVSARMFATGGMQASTANIAKPGARRLTYALVRQESTITLYVDGQLIGAATLAAAAPAFSQIAIGSQRGGGGQHLNGYTRRCIVYPRALGAAEIAGALLS